MVDNYFYGEESKEDPIFGIRTIGTTKLIEGDPIRSITASIRAGAGNVELGTMATGGSNGQQWTFEGVSKKQREALRELSRVSGTTITTHATAQIPNLSGFGKNGFSPEQRELSINEIKKAIDFAAEAANGGSVVVHTGEFQRPIGSFSEFEAYEDDAKKAPIAVVDEKTGRVQLAVDLERKIFRYKNIQDSGYDDRSKQMLERIYGGWDKVPSYVKETARKHKDFDPSTAEVEEITFADFEKQYGKNGRSRYELARDFLMQEQLSKIRSQNATNDYYLRQYESALQKKRELDKQDFSKFDDNKKFIFEQQKDEIENKITQLADIAERSQLQDRQIAEDLSQLKPIDSYALQQFEKTAVELAEYAREKTKVAQKQRPNDDIKPIQITMENIFPEFGYGSHPDELIDLVKRARDAYTQKWAPKVGKSEAAKQAKQHIGATLDTGHLNIWRKHFKGSDKDFEKWYTDKVQKMANEGVIGNVHIADNFGYDDSHLSAGEGNTPIKEVMRILKKSGFEGKVTSEGGFAHGGPEAGMHQTWKVAGSSIYGGGGYKGGSDAWVNPENRFYNVRGEWFGSANKPNFLFKGYAPDSEDWTPWSETRLE